MVHELKISPKYFYPVVTEDKTFEVRRNDRNFEIDDYISLNEYVAENNTYTGCNCLCRITFILDNPDFCKEGYVILGIKKVCHTLVSGQRVILRG